MSIIEIPHDTLVKVAENVTSSGLTILEGSKKYYRTQVATGEDAPSLPENLNKPRIPSTSIWIDLPWFNSTFTPKVASDLYIYCTGGDAETNGVMEVL